ncbi:MAG: AAA family ATPase [Chryseolinea sp.]
MYRDYQLAGKETQTIRLSKVNVFVGANNSGKSRLLRQLFIDLSRNRALTAGSFRVFSADDFSDANVRIIARTKEDLLHKTSAIIARINSNVLNEHTFSLEQIVDANSAVLHEGDLLSLIQDVEAKLKDVAKSEFYNHEDQVRRQSGDHYDRYLRYWRAGTDLLETLKSDLNLLYSSPDFSFTYLPALRTVRRFHKRKSDQAENKDPSLEFYPYAPSNFERLLNPVVRDKVLQDYFIKYSQKKRDWFVGGINYTVFAHEDSVFTGEDLYDRIFKLRNSVAETRQRLLDFETFLSENFFESKSVSINSLKKDNIEDVFIKIGESPEFPIQHLGDGIQALIILLFPLFEKRKENHLVFIEEPELYLHPAYQRLFVQILRKFDNTQAFLASHSNHILELCQEYPNVIALFKLEKSVVNNADKFMLSSFPAVSIEILNSLGVRNSSVFLANCTIWVEGISDRLYYRRYLEIFINNNPLKYANLVALKEDLHFAFVEYAGDNVTHWDFSSDKQTDGMHASGITNRIFLIHDNDAGKEDRFRNLQHALGDHFYKLQCREVENLLAPDILTMALQSYRKRNSEAKPLTQIEYSEYRDRDLGKFIDTIIVKDEFTRITVQATANSISKIADKADFATRAIAHLKNWNDLTEEAQAITIKLYNFIRIANNIR